jgi:hypothetical protein
MFGRVEVLTWVLCSVNDHIAPNTELYGSDCIQDARNPFALPRYRVNPAMVKMNELVQVEEKPRTFESGQFGQGRQ